MTGDPVYVKLTRPEGYEDACEQIVIEDAEIHPGFMPEPATEEVERLHRANGEIGLLLAESWDERDRLRAALKQAYLDAGCREGEAAEMVQAVSAGGSGLVDLDEDALKAPGAPGSAERAELYETTKESGS